MCIRDRNIEYSNIQAPPSSLKNEKNDLEGRQEINNKSAKLEQTVFNKYTGENNDLSTNFVVENTGSLIINGNNTLQPQSINKNLSKPKNSIKDFNSVYPNHNIENIEILNLGNVDPVSSESSFPNLINLKVFELSLIHI